MNKKLEITERIKNVANCLRDGFNAKDLLKAKYLPEEIIAAQEVNKERGQEKLL